MHTKLLEYFTENNLLFSQQYGFRPNRSTELATLELMDRNIHHMNENHCPVNPCSAEYLRLFFATQLNI